jgi:hypothetical protein
MSIIESSVAINHGQLMNLSEQQLIDCDTESCMGNLQRALYFAKQNGVCNDDYHFTGEPTTCRQCNKVVIVNETYHYMGEREMLFGLQKGPIAAIMDTHHINWYRDGIIADNVPSCTAGVTNLDVCCDWYAVNPHDTVTIVGYSEDYGYKYWIVRNSWADDWGDHGYAYVMRGANKCGIETEAYGVNAYEMKTSSSSSSDSSGHSGTTSSSSDSYGPDDAESSHMNCGEINGSVKYVLLLSLMCILEQLA